MYTGVDNWNTHYTHAVLIGRIFLVRNLYTCPRITLKFTDEGNWSHKNYTVALFDFSWVYFREQQPVNVVAIAVSICCIAALILPTQPEEVIKTQWPDWLHIGSNLKLVFSFVLGLVCMLVLRP